MNAKSHPTLGIVTALGIEFLAMETLLDSAESIHLKGIGKSILGEIRSSEGGVHNVVLIEAGIGNNMSAIQSEKLRNLFPSIETFVMVGIAGACPNHLKVEDHVRLGDIVAVGSNGIIQYDFLKKVGNESQHRNPPRPPSSSFLRSVLTLKREEETNLFPWNSLIEQAINRLGKKWDRPGLSKDILHDTLGNKVKHPKDELRQNGKPRAFIGTIASGNTLLKDPVLRDELRDKFGAKAVEMEASGLADASWLAEVNYYAVRGTCDYCDQHKNDLWQKYAAVVAAAYTKSIISSMPGIIEEEAMVIPLPNEAVSPLMGNKKNNISLTSIEEALADLKKAYPNENEVILLAFRFNELQKRNRHKTISESRFQLQQNQLFDDILGLIQALEKRL
jgi:nucleoside phosphorylase